MESITGIIYKIIYHNESTGYSVFRLEDGSAAVGVIPKLDAGEEIELKGEWVIHPKFGRQFNFDQFTISHQKSLKEIKKFLASGFIKGIGEFTAENIIRKFGDRTFDVFENDIGRLTEIHGIGKKKIETIKKSWIEHREVRNIMLLLQRYGIPAAYAYRIYKTYGEESIKVVEENPYRLAYDVWGIGFKTADEIGRHLGFEESHPMRLKAGIIYILNEVVRNGHVYLPENDLIQKCRYLLHTEMIMSDPLLVQLELEGLIVIEQARIYLSQYFFAERSIEDRLKQLIAFRESIITASKHQIPNSNEFSDEQIDAIKKSFESKVLILTGGPGTGKTSTVNGIIDLYRNEGKKVLLAAPTGRAAKRMTELSGLEAKTIHRLLEYNPSDNYFNYNNVNQLEADLVVIDEVSMIDTLLMAHLMDAVSDETNLVLVGDTDQLPSVGAGNVLKDLINDGKIPVVTLTKIFRQATASRIVMAAHTINKGKIPDISEKKDSDLLFIEKSDQLKIPDLILDLCNNYLPANYNFNPIHDVQIIAPMYKGPAGVDNLNKYLQGGLNHNRTEFSRGGKEYKLSDKVMQLRNNYEKDVFNGDLGILSSYDYEGKTATINFNDKFINYDYNELEDVTLAYAVTVHKSQGSEYPCVILPLTRAHYIMFQRNLLYTAITRASKLLIIIGTKELLKISVENNNVQHRFTSLFQYQR